jgi:hypothetical protein
MKTCGNCYFWKPETAGVDAGNCMVDPPKIYPLPKQDRTIVLQNMYPTTTRDDYCHWHQRRSLLARFRLWLAERRRIIPCVEPIEVGAAPGIQIVSKLPKI